MGREQAARATAEELIAAIAAGDALAVASLMSSDAQDELLSAARRRGVHVATAQDAAVRLWGGGWTALFAEVQVDTVQIEGDRATVTYRHATYGRDPDDLFVLVEVDGRWLVDSFPYEEDDSDPLC